MPHAPRRGAASPTDKDDPRVCTRNLNDERTRCWNGLRDGINRLDWHAVHGLEYISYLNSCARARTLDGSHNDAQFGRGSVVTRSLIYSHPKPRNLLRQSEETPKERIILKRVAILPLRLLCGSLLSGLLSFASGSFSGSRQSSLSSARAASPTLQGSGHRSFVPRTTSEEDRRPQTLLVPRQWRTGPCIQRLAH